MSGNEVDLLQWESLVSGVEGVDYSVIACSSVVTTANDPSSDLPSVVCSSVVASEVT